MTTNQWGILLGLVGAVFLAWSSNSLTRRLPVWLLSLDTTVRALAEQDRDVPVFIGHDKAFARDLRNARVLGWLGWLAMFVGFALQFAASV